MGVDTTAPLPDGYFDGQLGGAAPDDELLAWLNARFAAEQVAVGQTIEPQVDVYLDSALGLDTNDGSEGLPVKTLAGLAAVSPRIFGPVTRHVVLHLRGTIDAPSAEVTESLHFRFNPSEEPGVAPVFVVDGGPGVTTVLDDGAGADIVSDINAAGQVGLSTATWTDDEWRGYWCVFSTGALAGQRFVVRGNTPTTLRLLDVGPDFVGDPGAGAEFHLERPTTEITSPALSGLALLFTISGRADFYMQNLYFSGGAMIGVGLSGAENKATLSHIVHAGGADVEKIALLGNAGTQPCEIAINGHLYDTTALVPDAVDLGTERIGLSQVGNSDPLENVQQGGKFSVRYSVLPMVLEAYSDRSRYLGSWVGQYTARYSRMGSHEAEPTGGHTAEDGDVPGVPTVFGGYRAAGAPAVEVYPAIIAEDSSIGLNKSILDESTWGIQAIKSYCIVREVDGTANSVGGALSEGGSLIKQYRGGGSGVSTLSGNSGTVEISEDGATELAKWSTLAGLPVQTPVTIAEDYTPPAFLPAWQG
jgi:hypothetical protein